MRRKINGVYQPDYNVRCVKCKQVVNKKEAKAIINSYYCLKCLERGVTND